MRFSACLKTRIKRRVRARGLQQAGAIPLFCRPSPLTGRVFKHALRQAQRRRRAEAGAAPPARRFASPHHIRPQNRRTGGSPHRFCSFYRAVDHGRARLRRAVTFPRKSSFGSTESRPTDFTGPLVSGRVGNGENGPPQRFTQFRPSLDDFPQIRAGRGNWCAYRCVRICVPQAICCFWQVQNLRRAPEQARAGRLLRSR